MMEQLKSLRTKFPITKFILTTYGTWSELEIRWIKTSIYDAIRDGAELLESISILQGNYEIKCHLEYSENSEWVSVKIYKLVIYEYIKDEGKLRIWFTDGSKLIYQLKSDNKGYCLTLQSTIEAYNERIINS